MEKWTDNINMAYCWDEKRTAENVAKHYGVKIYEHTLSTGTKVYLVEKNGTFMSRMI